MNQSFSFQKHGVTSVPLSPRMTKGGKLRSSFVTGKQDKIEGESYVISELQLNQDLFHKLKNTENTLLENEERLEVQTELNRNLKKQINDLKKRNDQIKTVNKELILKTKNFEKVLSVKDQIISCMNEKLNSYQWFCQTSEETNQRQGFRCQELQTLLDRTSNS